ncbi:MAG: hypothetical protein HRU20_19715 [Pseudomonadales bacterium]|nr:hypothetical protein [Pseudomonadales bacterium]
MEQIKKERLRQLSTIAKHLGKGWRVDSRQLDRVGCFSLMHPVEKMRISVSYGGWRRQSVGRIYLRGVSPVELHLSINCKEISVAENRHFIGIARDIKRRLLPRYTEALEKALAQAELKKGVYDNECYVEHLLKRVGLPSFHKHYDRACSNAASFGSDTPNPGKIRVYGANNVDISIRGLDAEKAIRLAHFLKDLAF